jgi:hypothetical protein
MLAACHTVPPTPAAPASETGRAIEVMIRAPVATAAGRVTAALVSQGFTPAASSSPTVLVTAPLKHNNATTVVVTVALVPADSATTRAIVSGAYSVQVLAIRTETADSHRGGLNRQVWQRVQGVANAIKAQP